MYLSHDCRDRRDESLIGWLATHREAPGFGGTPSQRPRVQAGRGQTVTATVAAADAWETVKGEYPEFLDRSQWPVEASLALVTTEGHGKTNPDGSVTPKFQDRLAWVFTVRDVQIFPLIGAIPGEGEPAERPKLTGCVTRFLVDAVDGSYAGAWQSCMPA